MLIVVLVLVGLSTGSVAWYRVASAPERLFEEGRAARGLASFANAAASWQQAHELGHAGATAGLAELYLHGKGVSRNHRRAFELFSAAADRGDVGAQLELAKLYEDGRGVGVDLGRAALWYWTAAKNGEPSAHYELGRLHEAVDDVEAAIRNYERVLELRPGHQTALERLDALRGAP